MMLTASSLSIFLGIVTVALTFYVLFIKREAGYEGFADHKQFSTYAKISPEDEPDAHTILSVTDVLGKGGRLKNKAKLYIPDMIRSRHMLVLGKEGSGVISRVILPVLLNDVLEPDRSVVVFDTTGSMWKNLANLSHHHCPKKKIVRFNPLQPEKSMSWNFVSHLTDEFECGRMSRLIFSVTHGNLTEGSPEIVRALSLLQAVFLGSAGEAEEVSMPKVYQLLKGGRESLSSWIQSRPEAVRIASSFVELSAQNPSEADEVIAELLMRLHLWDKSSVRAVTAESEINPAELASQPSVIILEFDEPSHNSLRPLATILFCELLRGLIAYSDIRNGRYLQHPFGIVCPDFGSVFERIPDLPEKLSSLSSRNISVLAAVNSIEEIRHAYQESSPLVIGNFYSKLVLPPLGSEDATWAAREFGYTEDSESGSKSYPGPEQFLAGKEIRATFQLPSISPFQANLVPYFHNESLLEKFHRSMIQEELDVRELS